jgi:hypothetical protein
MPPLQCWRCAHNPLSVKHFHGVLAGNVHERSLKSRIGKVSCIGPLTTRRYAAASATFAARRAHFQSARDDTYGFGCGNGISQKLLASTRSGLFDLAL